MGVSLKRFNGWEPEQVHYDLAGNETGRTRVEPEWDDEQRQIMLDLFEYESQICPGCGGHYSQTRDKSLARNLGEGKDVCWDCYSIEKQMQVHHGQHGKDCDCHEWKVWVEGYGPSPSRT